MSLFAKIGTQTALNFSFGFLVSTWRSGNNSDLCTQMLKDSLEALQCIPEDYLVDESNVPTFWIETLEKSSKFLFQVVNGYYKINIFPIERDIRRESATGRRPKHVHLRESPLYAESGRHMVGDIWP